VLQSNNRLLCKPFSEEETKIDLWQMEKNKAIGRDKSLLSSISIVGLFVKKDIVQLFDDFFTTE